MISYQKIKNIANSINPFYNNINIDFIGDIHGYYDNLQELLTKLNYKSTNKIWSHHNNKALFLGDFINRGENSKKTLELIKNMVDNNYAYAILGNHELYFLEYYYSLKHKRKTKLSQAHINQIKNVFSEFDNANEIDNYAKWLSSLPLYYDFKKIRAVHAYWSNKNIYRISKRLKNETINNKISKEIFKEKSKFSKAVWQTVKGVEFKIPRLAYKKYPKINQSNFRIKWWLNYKDKTLKKISFDSRISLPNIPITTKNVRKYQIYKSDEPILMFGHYCQNKLKPIQRANICCLDGCIAGDGKHILSYRWSGEKKLKSENIIIS